jgi:hypothetical protein
MDQPVMLIEPPLVPAPNGGHLDKNDSGMNGLKAGIIGATY